MQAHPNAEAHHYQQEPEKQRLLSGSTVLEDGKTLADAGVENDAVLALVYQQSGACFDAQSCSVQKQHRPDGSWEDVDIETPMLDEGQ